eukprot:TRINITY_DN1489_c0_g2_i1.p1 TRINITY_DN1489_c0_g2~~TRINITY_DN1489_c0_g2_i1.p1  ORF type:complete len:427 (-),score=187.89 TRINITY_DN1489_c0_g2_i1:419-1699(-)
MDTNKNISSSSVNFDPLQRSRSLSAERKSDSSQLFGNLPPRVKLSAEDVSQDVVGLKKLMDQGSWRNVIKLCDKCIANGMKYPHDLLQLKLCKIISLLKLRQYKAVSDEIDQLGSFDESPNTFQSYPQLYSNLFGSFVPFSLRVIKAQLPEFLKTGNSLDEMFQLLSLCKKQIETLNSNEESMRRKDTSSSSVLKLVDHLTPLFTPSSPFPSSPSSIPLEDFFFGNFDESVGNWKDREVCISLIIATRLVQEKEYPLAISMLQDISKKYPNNSSLLSGIGRVYLQMGNIKTASVVFKQIESLEGEADQSIISMNKGFLALALNQFTIAIDHFQQVLVKNPKDVTAANNKAVCLLYTCNLSHAISSLEDFVFRDPENNLNESLVFNLCTLYDLKSENSLEKKKNILALVGKYASDDFDFSFVKLNGT